MKLHIYRTYRFTGQDPALVAAVEAIEDEGFTAADVDKLTGVTVYNNWKKGITQRPNNATLTACTSGLGLARRDKILANGQYQVEYVRVRDIDVEAEMEKQKAWMIKEGRRLSKLNRKKKK